MSHPFYRRVPVQSTPTEKGRLPGRPIQRFGGQQVNGMSRYHETDKFVMLDESEGYGSIAISTFHYSVKKWFMKLENKNIDITNVVTHWLEQVDLPTEEEIIKHLDKNSARDAFSLGAKWVINKILNKK